MSPRSKAQRAADIVRSIEAIESYVGEMSYVEFRANRLVVDAVAMNLQAIGEAAKQLVRSDGRIAAEYPAIDWVQVAGLRNEIAHEYFRIDVEKVWTTVQDVLPKLKAAAAEII